ncbi:hypothetical protein CHS0354_035963 [Potamilus streckersoni]|uniref:Uncharacterized protein n=1 Tax=Potamilus streckersoni TaxID=2493646 RepID=A0AAE0WCK2_9BIVA|nr:hypothetical protein CHS0354_035963 [Potamilus streckersoni]
MDKLSTSRRPQPVDGTEMKNLKTDKVTTTSGVEMSTHRTYEKINTLITISTESKGSCRYWYPGRIVENL